ncbi:MAG: hypothetical protein ACJ77K_01530 [Bacteroidia bacterium]
MARGIITNNGSGGVPPKLVITGFDPQQRKVFVPGDELECISKIPLQVGFLVEGTLDPTGQSKVVTVTSVIDSNPVVVTGNQGGQTTIGPDKAYLIEPTGQLTGNVSINGGTLYVNGGKANGNVQIAANSTIIASNGATIGGGTFEVTGSGNNAVVAFSKTTINGKFSTNGITFVNLGGNNFNGNVSSNKDEYVTIVGNQVNNTKDLTVTAVVVECSVMNNTVSGTTTIDPKCQQ